MSVMFDSFYARLITFSYISNKINQLPKRSANYSMQKKKAY